MSTLEKCAEAGKVAMRDVISNLPEGHIGAINDAIALAQTRAIILTLAANLDEEAIEVVARHLCGANAFDRASEMTRDNWRTTARYVITTYLNKVAGVE